ISSLGCGFELYCGIIAGLTCGSVIALVHGILCPHLLGRSNRRIEAAYMARERLSLLLGIVMLAGVTSVVASLLVDIVFKPPDIVKTTLVFDGVVVALMTAFVYWPLYDNDIRVIERLTWSLKT